MRAGAEPPWKPVTIHPMLPGSMSLDEHFTGVRVVRDGEGTEVLTLTRAKRVVTTETARFDARQHPLDAPTKTRETLASGELAAARFASLAEAARAEGHAPPCAERVKRLQQYDGTSEKPIAAVLWCAKTPLPAYALYVDGATCWAGNNEGLIHVLDHDGARLRGYQVPKGVGCILRDDAWIYAGCDDGRVYDLSRDEALMAYEVSADDELLAMAVHDGELVVADWSGRVATFDHESGQRWSVTSGEGDGWALVCTDEGIAHGHALGITGLDWDGNERWRKALEGAATSGCARGDVIAVSHEGGGVALYDPTGRRVARLACDAPATACCLSDDGTTVYAADHLGSLYAFSIDGTRRWALSAEPRMGAAFALGCHGDRLFAATENGSIYCVDVSPDAVSAALRGERPAARAIELPRRRRGAKKARPTVVETTDASAGVTIVCVREGGRLRARVASVGYEPTWNCQFPNDLREEGARFVVDAVTAARRGGFYRVQGAIRRLVDEAAPKKAAPKKRTRR